MVATVHWSTMDRMHRRFELVPAGLSQKLCWSLHWLHSTKSCCCTLGSLWHFIKRSFLLLSFLVMTSPNVCSASSLKLSDSQVRFNLRCNWNPFSQWPSVVCFLRDRLRYANCDRLRRSVLHCDPGVGLLLPVLLLHCWGPVGQLQELLEHRCMCAQVCLNLQSSNPARLTSAKTVEELHLTLF